MINFYVINFVILLNNIIKNFAFENVYTIVQEFMETQYNLYKKKSYSFIIYTKCVHSFFHILKGTKVYVVKGIGY